MRKIYYRYFFILLLILIGLIPIVNVSGLAQRKAVKVDTTFWAENVLYSTPYYKVRETPEVDSLVKQMEGLGKIQMYPGDQKILKVYKTIATSDTMEYYARPYIPKGTGTFASYLGGNEGFIHYLQTHMQAAGNLKVSSKKDTAIVVAKIYINFLIEKNGTISDVKLTNDIDHQTDVELVRVIKLSVWKPAIINGQPVASGYDMPIEFVKK